MKKLFILTFIAFMIFSCQMVSVEKEINTDDLTTEDVQTEEVTTPIPEGHGRVTIQLPEIVTSKGMSTKDDSKNLTKRYKLVLFNEDGHYSAGADLGQTSLSLDVPTGYWRAVIIALDENGRMVGSGGTFAESKISSGESTKISIVMYSVSAKLSAPNALESDAYGSFSGYVSFGSSMISLQKNGKISVAGRYPEGDISIIYDIDIDSASQYSNGYSVYKKAMLTNIDYKDDGYLKVFPYIKDDQKLIIEYYDSGNPYSLDLAEITNEPGLKPISFENLGDVAETIHTVNSGSAEVIISW